MWEGIWGCGEVAEGGCFQSPCLSSRALRVPLSNLSPQAMGSSRFFLAHGGSRGPGVRPGAEWVRVRVGNGPVWLMAESPLPVLNLLGLPLHLEQSWISGKEGQEAGGKRVLFCFQRMHSISRGGGPRDCPAVGTLVACVGAKIRCSCDGGCGHPRRAPCPLPGPLVPVPATASPSRALPPRDTAALSQL